MQPLIQQTTVYPIHLPQFLNNFKQQVVNLIVPRLLELKVLVNSDKHATAVNPLVLILFIVVILYVLKSIWSGLFGKREIESHSAFKDSPELNAEVNQLKKQLKSLKASFSQLIKEIPKSNLSTTIQPVDQHQNSRQLQSETSELWAQVLPLYALSLENNKKLVNYVLESQFQMLKELKRFKKAQRASLSSGRPSTSTIRSKTSEKKLQKLDNSVSKSPMKTPINTASSIKKPEIKNSQRSVRSQIHQQTEKQTESLSFLVKQQSPRKETNIQIISNETVTETSYKVQDRNGFEKVDKTWRQKTVEELEQESLIPSAVNVKSPKLPASKKPQVSIKTTHTEQQISSFVKQQTFSGPQVQVQSEALNIEQPQRESVDQSIGTPYDSVQETEAGKPQLQEVQVFVPVKIPAIKKLNPPKQGAKRPPPPPPKK